MAKLLAFMAAAVLMLALTASARPIGEEAAVGRKLLAATDNRFDYYTQQYPGYNVMVCNSCDATGLTDAQVAGASDGGFQIWVMQAGVIVRSGDGGLDNWQFSGNFVRGGNQGSIVTFSPLSG